jgi:hypothetical protein
MVYGDDLPNTDIFGETPKTAAETAALPEICCIVPANKVF